MYLQAVCYCDLKLLQQTVCLVPMKTLSHIEREKGDDSFVKKVFIIFYLSFFFIFRSEKSNILLGSYPTRHTPVHHLHFTRRNLLMSSGPYLPPPTATTSHTTPSVTAATTTTVTTPH